MFLALNNFSVQLISCITWFVIFITSIMNNDATIFNWNGKLINKLEFVTQHSLTEEFHYFPTELQGKFESVAIFG